jgi:hypothetical protein
VTAKKQAEIASAMDKGKESGATALNVLAAPCCLSIAVSSSLRRRSRPSQAISTLVRQLMLRTKAALVFVRSKM